MKHRNTLRDRLLNICSKKVGRASRLSTGREATDTNVGRASRLSTGRNATGSNALHPPRRIRDLAGQPGRLSYILSALAATDTNVGRASRLSTSRNATGSKAPRPPRRIRDLSGQPGRLSYILSALAAVVAKVGRASRLSTSRNATGSKAPRPPRRIRDLSGQPGRLSYILSALAAVVAKVGRASRLSTGRNATGSKAPRPPRRIRDLSGQPGRLSYILSALAAVVAKVGRASRLSTSRNATGSKAPRPPRRIRDLSGQPERLSYFVVALGAALCLIGLWAITVLPPAAFANSGGQVTYYTLTKCTPTGGAILASPIGPSYVSGTVVTLTADPDTGYVFSHWTGSVSGASNPVTITMNANKSVCAVFVHAKLTVHKVGNGQVHVDPPDVTRTPTFYEDYDTDTTVTVTAVPDSGWRFLRWEDGSENTLSEDDNYEVFVTGDTVITAVFSDRADITFKYTTQAYLPELEFSPTPISVTDNGTSKVATVQYGSTLNFALAGDDPMDEESGIAFHRWRSTGEGFDGSLAPGDSVVASTDKVIRVEGRPYYGVGPLEGLWQSQFTYATPEDYLGPESEEPAGGIYYFKAGTPIILTAKTTAFDFVRWHYNDASGVEHTLEDPDLPLTMDRHWTARPEYDFEKRLTVSGLANGHVVANAPSWFAPIYFYSGTPPYYADVTTSFTINVSAVPDSGYNFFGWGPFYPGNGSNIRSTPLTLMMKQDIQVQPEFTLPAVVQAVEVLDGHHVRVTFSLEMDNSAKYDGTSYTLSGTGQGPLADHPAGITHEGGGVYTLAWTSGSMAQNGDITITVSNGVKDAAGNDMGATRSGTDVGGGIGEDLAPVAAFSADPTLGAAPLMVEFTDESVPGTHAITSWAWDFGDGTGASTAQHPSYTYEDPGVYSVSLTVESAAGEDTHTAAGLISVGAEDAVLSVLPSMLQFGYVPAGQTKNLTLQVRNDGEGLLSGTAEVEAPFSILEEPEFTLEPGTHRFFTVQYAPAAAEIGYDVIGFLGGGNALIDLHGSSITPQANVTTGVRLNELAIWNTTGLQSGNGDYVDWIELYNENNVAVDLGGWSLTDDENTPTKYVIPAGTVIGPESFLLLFASVDPAPIPGELHTGFELDEVNGGYLGLFAPSAGTALSEVEYPVIDEPDRSYSLLEDEESFFEWVLPATPTPFSLNRNNMVWELDVWVCPSLDHEILQLIPDPNRNITQHTGGVDDFVTIYEWLPIVANYTTLVLHDDTDAHIVSPIHPNQSEVSKDVPSDLHVAAEVQFNLDPVGQVRVVNGMPHKLESLEHILRTAKSVSDGSMVVCEKIELNVQGQTLPRLGWTFLSRSKKVTIIAALTLDPEPRLKWHSKTFAHELGHYAGIVGHFVGPNPPGDPLIIDTSLMRETDTFHTGPNSEEWHEPWFLVNVTGPAKRFFEGTAWGSAEQRNQNPDYLFEEGYHIADYESDLLGANESRLSNPSILPW